MLPIVLNLDKRVQQLRIQIAITHSNYVYEENSPDKIRCREVLEGYIKEFINSVPHDEKFHPAVAEILRRSVLKTSAFNALNAASAWLAISTYACNLLTQPWRKEYHEIRLYSGFYKHHIENYLQGAEVLLELMGYELEDNYKMVIRRPLNRDALISVSLYALTAMCECQILFNIYKDVSKHFVRCTWSYILNIRETYVCSVDSAIRAILSYCAPNYCTECLYPPYSPYPANCRKCGEITSKLHSTHANNGYHYPNNVPYRESPCSNGHCNYVPTEKLIDIDDPLESCSYRKSTHLGRGENSSRYSDATIDEFLRKKEKIERLRKSLDQSKEAEKDRHWNMNTNCVSEALNNLKLSPDSGGSCYVDEVDDSKKSSSSKKNSDRKKPDNRVKKVNSKSKSSTTPWECTKCTYVNTVSKDICEMCFKSRHFDSDTPLISGGKDCNKCTFVNEKNATECAVCKSDLKNCPVYV